MSDFAEKPSQRSRDIADEPRRRRDEDDDDDDRRGPDDYDIRRRGTDAADRGSRLVAAIIDGVLMILCSLPGIIIIFSSVKTVDPTSLIGNPFAMFQFALVGTLVQYIGIFAYQGAMAYMISQSGQTIGKKAMGIRIVRYEDGKLPGVVNGWVLRWLVPWAISLVPILGGLFGLVDVLFIFGEEKRCIHDLIASTKVVVAEPLGEGRRDRDDY